jgi:hypothetical protein
MKTLFLLLGIVAFAFLTTGCATHASVNTPVVDVGAGASVL